MILGPRLHVRTIRGVSLESEGSSVVFMLHSELSFEQKLFWLVDLA